MGREITLKEMEPQVRYRVTRADSKGTLKAGDVVYLEPTGDLVNVSAQGWIGGGFWRMTRVRLLLDMGYYQRHLTHHEEQAKRAREIMAKLEEP